jgi:hypothetical protein
MIGGCGPLCIEAVVLLSRDDVIIQAWRLESLKLGDNGPPTLEAIYIPLNMKAEIF